MSEAEKEPAVVCGSCGQVLRVTDRYISERLMPGTPMIMIVPHGCPRTVDQPT